MKTPYIIFFLLSLPLQAQIKNFQPGYYYQQAGDSIRAAISQEGSDYLSVQVREEDGDIQALSTTDIQGFGFPEQGIHYRKITHTFTSAGGEEMMVPRFALVLVDGKNTLFRVELQGNEYFQALSDVKNYVYYLQRPLGRVYKLERVEEQLTQSRFRVQEKYRGALRYLMADWPEVNKRVEKLKFRDEDLSGLVTDYNLFLNPTGSNVVLNTSDKGKRWHQLSLSGSPRSFNVIGNNSLGSTFTGDYSLRFQNVLQSNSLTMGAGLGVLLLTPLDDEGQNEWLLRVPLEAAFLLTHKSKLRPTLSLFIIPTYGQEEKTFTIRLNNDGNETSTRTVSYTEGILFGMAGPGLSVALGPVGINLRVEHPLLGADFFNLSAVPTYTFLGLSYELGRGD